MGSVWKGSRWIWGARCGVGIGISVLLLATAFRPQPVLGQEVTFAEDVAPILYESCVGCHRPGGMGPMSLLTYEIAAQYAPLIKFKVESRIMPPWHIDKTVGIQDFKDDISLTDEEIATIVAWVDAGAPRGEGEPPPVPELPDGDVWRLAERFGPPDLIIQSLPIDVPDSGLDQWWDPPVKVTGLDKPRWVMADEVRPSAGVGRQIIHHANTNLIRDGKNIGSLAKYGVGKPYSIYPENTGNLIKPGDVLGFNIHYSHSTGGGGVKDDVVEVGLWFYPEGYEPRLATTGEQGFSSMRDQARGSITLSEDEQQVLVIPPHGRSITQGVTVLKDPMRIHSIRGHMHLRGTAQVMEAIYPDGTREILNKVNWQGNWHIAYLYEDHAMPLLPRGTVLLITAWYDNTDANPINPDPDQWVVYGRRSADDMSHMHVGVTYLSDEDFAWLKSERQQQLREIAANAGG